MDVRPTAKLRAGRGIVDNADQGGSRQVTVVARERWETIAEVMGVAVDPALRRANLLVSGVELEGSRGRILRVGDCRLQVNGETRPCERMDAALPGLRSALDPNWGGGVYAKVLDDGVITEGDDVTWEEGL